MGARLGWHNVLLLQNLMKPCNWDKPKSKQIPHCPIFCWRTFFCERHNCEIVWKIWENPIKCYKIIQISLQEINIVILMWDNSCFVFGQMYWKYKELQPPPTYYPSWVMKQKPENVYFLPRPRFTPVRSEFRELNQKLTS